MGYEIFCLPCKEQNGVFIASSAMLEEQEEELPPESPPRKPVRVKAEYVSPDRTATRVKADYVSPGHTATRVKAEYASPERTPAPTAGGAPGERGRVKAVAGCPGPVDAAVPRRAARGGGRRLRLLPDLRDPHHRGEPGRGGGRRRRPGPAGAGQAAVGRDGRGGRPRGAGVRGG